MANLVKAFTSFADAPKTNGCSAELGIFRTLRFSFLGPSAGSAWVVFGAFAKLVKTLTDCVIICS